MGGFACSSWYFLRFADPHNDKEPFSKEAVNYWLPVDTYAGGAEHAVMHLLYARFWTKALHDAGLLNFVEPFTTLRNQGMMLAWTPGRRPAPNEDAAGEETEEQIEDWKVLKPEERAVYPEDQVIWRWAKMSKSSGNVVTPDDMATQYGADALRVYEMFVAPFEETVQWSEEGIRGSSKFLRRVYALVAQFGDGFFPIGLAHAAGQPDRQGKGAAAQDAPDHRARRRRPGKLPLQHRRRRPDGVDQRHVRCRPHALARRTLGGTG